MLKKVFLLLILLTSTIIASFGFYLVLMMKVYSITAEETFKVTIKMIELLLANKAYKINPKTITIIIDFVIPFWIFLFVILSFFLLRNKKKSNTYGNAQYAKLKDLKKLTLNQESGVWLCNFNDNKVTKNIIPIKTSEPLAILVIAPPGTGKTHGILLPSLYTLKNSCVIFDIKGELHDFTAYYRKEYLKNEILVFNPFDIKITTEEVVDENGEISYKRNIDYKKHSMFFNPFDKELIKDLTFAELRQLVQQMASIIFVKEAQNADPHWINSAKIMFVFFAMHNICTKGTTTFFELSQAPNRNYYDELQGEYKLEASEEDEETGELRQRIGANVIKIYFNQIANSKPQKLFNNTSMLEYQIIQNEARKYLDTCDTQEYSGVMTTYLLNMGIFCDPRIMEATNKNNFNYQDLRNKKTSLYIMVSQNDMEILSPLVRILAETIAKNLCSGEEVGKNSDKYIYFFLEEFVRFGKMEFLLRMPELSRSYGVVPIYVSQSYEQFKLVYSQDHLNILLSITHYQVIFRFNNQKDAEIASKNIGKYTREKETISKKGIFQDDNVSVSEEGVALITDQDFMSKNARECIVLVSGNKNKPLKGFINFWYENKDLIRCKELNDKLKEQKNLI